MKIILVLLALAGVVPAAAADEPPAASDFCFIRQLLPVKTGGTGPHINPLFFDGETGVFSNPPFPASDIQIPARVSAAGAVERNSGVAEFLSLVGYILASITWPAGAGESPAYSQYCEEKFIQYHEEKRAEERLLGHAFFGSWNR